MRDEDNTKLSRSEKYKDLYNEEYSNVTVDFDLSNLIDDEYTETMEFDNDIIETIAYKEKDYDINNFLKEMKKEAKEDLLPRSLSENIEMMNNEINNIIETMNKEIEESNDDFFGDLMPDDENTIVTDSNEESNTNGVGGIVSDTVINNFLMNKDLTDTHSFIDDTDSVEKVEEKEKEEKKEELFEDKKIAEKITANPKIKKLINNKKLSIIVFITMLLIIILLVFYILFLR